MDECPRPTGGHLIGSFLIDFNSFLTSESGNNHHIVLTNKRSFVSLISVTVESDTMMKAFTLLLFWSAIFIIVLLVVVILFSSAIFHRLKAPTYFAISAINISLLVLLNFFILLFFVPIKLFNCWPLIMPQTKSTTHNWFPIRHFIYPLLFCPALCWISQQHPELSNWHINNKVENLSSPAFNWRVTSHKVMGLIPASSVSGSVLFKFTTKWSQLTQKSSTWCYILVSC